MKPLLILIGIFISVTTIGQADSVKSWVYSWKNLKPVKEETRERSQVFQGSTHSLQDLEIHVTTIQPGKSPHPPHKHDDSEELIIVKSGRLTITINDKTEELGPGSVAMAMPGDMHGFNNAGESAATYYVIKYKAKLPLDGARGKNAGGSFMINYKNVAFTPHDKGGRRNFFERPTAAMKRFEMHVTTLNAGMKSHDAHTHVAEEIILMIQGDATMQIGRDNFPRIQTGDVCFLNSNVPHALNNTGKGPATYFAFQWQNQ
jgi:(S)-ureidoglycine aminohydrolase